MRAELFFLVGFGLLMTGLSASVSGGNTADGFTVNLQGPSMSFNFDSEIEFESMSIGEELDFSFDDSSYFLSGSGDQKLVIESFDPESDPLLEYSPEENNEYDLVLGGDTDSGNYGIRESDADGSTVTDPVSIDEEEDIRVTVESDDTDTEESYFLTLVDDIDILVDNLRPNSTNVDHRSFTLEFEPDSVGDEIEADGEINITENGEQRFWKELGDVDTAENLFEEEIEAEEDLDSDKQYQLELNLTGGGDTLIETAEFTTIEVNISWEYSGEDEDEDGVDGYRIYSNATGDYRRIDTVEADGSDEYEEIFVDPNFEFDQFTCIQITSFSQEGESEEAEECGTFEQS